MSTRKQSVQSSFDGKIHEILEISVDNFESNSKMAYFLSHMHSDHTNGLFGDFNSGRLRSNGGKIYMSEISYTILKHAHWQFGNINNIVEPLQTGMTYTIDLPNNECFQVTLIEVKHMPGAMMFLFKTRDKTVLYTGDFAMETDEVSGLERLHDDNGQPVPIDALYVDATFDTPDYEHFPRREDTVLELTQLARPWLQAKNHRLALYSYYDYAYEDLYKTLYEEFGIKTFIDNTTMRDVYKDVNGDDNFATNECSSQIHKCLNNKYMNDHSKCGIKEFNDFEYIYIVLAAANGCNYDPRSEQTALNRLFDSKSYTLIYHTHCSKSQLDYFIKYFSPGSITRFPRTPKKPPSPSARTPYKKSRARPSGDAAKRQLNFS